MSPISVDVIMPTHNHLAYLPDAIRSVLRQSHSDLTLYVVDDGSTDGTAEYVRSLQDSRIRYVSKQNGGPNSARNVGIRSSSAPYVAFLDADDVWYPLKLEKQISIMQADHSVGLVYGHHDWIDETGALAGQLVISKRGDILEDLLEGNCIAGSCSLAMIRRDTLGKVGLFNENFRYGEDWEMWIRLATRYRIDYVPEVIGAIRRSASRTSDNYRLMADRLVAMLPHLLQGLDLTPAQKRHLSGTCHLDAAVFLVHAGDRSRSRKHYVRALKAWPWALFRKNRVFLGVRLIFGNRLYRWIRRRILFGSDH